MDEDVRRGTASRIFYRACKFFCQILAVLLADHRSYGVRRVPRQGGAVIASNHQSYLDPVLVGLCIPRICFFLARESLFRFPGFRQLIEALNALPIPRTGAGTRRAIEYGRAVVRGGDLVMVFPEGTRSRDGKMGPVKRGVELISGPLRNPVVPALIDGAFEMWPRTGGLRFRPIRVFFGEPLVERGSGADNSNGMCADLVSRLESSYRSLEARAREVRWAGVACPGGRLRYFG